MRNTVASRFARPNDTILLPAAADAHFTTSPALGRRLFPLTAWAATQIPVAAERAFFARQPAVVLCPTAASRLPASVPGASAPDAYADVLLR